MTDDPQRVLKLHGLFENSLWQASLQWLPFFPRVEIHRLYENGPDGPRAALLRFGAGGRIPLHRHSGYEHIVVLEGGQVDENGEAAKGSVIINPPGTCHSVSSEHGCIVLAIYEKPVKFLQRTGS
jgi:predicted ChrR family anti-sigma factor